MARSSIINDGPAESGEPMVSINVTSLVDVMFCLLIMFMVSAPLESPDGEKVELPAARGEKIAKEENLYQVISIDAKGNHFLGGMALSNDPDKLKAEITGNAKIGEDGVLFIQADKNLDHSKIVDLLILLKDANVNEVGFMIDPNAKKIREARGRK